MRTIKISEDTYARLQGLAKPFEDSPEDVIIRLIAATEKTVSQAPRRPARSPGVRSKTGADLVSQGGRILHGTKLRAVYKDEEYRAEVRDGQVWWNGSSYRSLSAAAVAVIQSTGSNRPTEDGWRFWKLFDEETRQWVSKADPAERLR